MSLPPDQLPTPICTELLLVDLESTLTYSNCNKSFGTLDLSYFERTQREVAYMWQLESNNIRAERIHVISYQLPYHTTYRYVKKTGTTCVYPHHHHHHYQHHQRRCRRQRHHFIPLKSVILKMKIILLTVVLV